MYLMKKFVLSLGFLVCAATAQAQTVTISDEISASPGTQAVTVSYEAGSDLASFSVRIDFDPALLDPQTDTAANPNVDGCLVDLPGSHTGSFTGCNNPTPGAIALTVTDQLSGTVLPTTDVGTITFDVASGITPGTIIPIEMTFLSATTDTGAALTAGDVTLDDGSITAEVPAGESFYSSNPAIGANIDFGSAVVNSPAGVQAIAVQNLQDGSSDFQITGAGGTSTGATIAVPVPTFPQTIPANGGTTTANINFECTPTARGDQSGTLTIENDSDNAGPEAGYEFDCAGLAPLVTVTNPTPSPVTVLALPGGDDASATGTISEAGDQFSRDVENITYSVGTIVGPAGMGSVLTVTATGPATVAEGDTADYTVTCEAPNDQVLEGTFDFNVTVTWDNPDPNGFSEATVPFACKVLAARPVYTSNPAPGAELNFGTVTNGVESAPIGIEVTNDGEGPDPASDLEITAASANNANFSVAFNGSKIGVNDTLNDAVTVTCTPEETGEAAGFLTVNTNDPDEPRNGFTYELTCTGESDGTFASTPAAGGTLDLGIVTPGDTTPEGFIDFTNNGAVDDIEVSCTVDDPDDVFTFTPDPIAFTLAPAATESAGFQCTPTIPTSFEATVSCSIGGDPAIQTANYSVICQGQPLFVPTMNRWGLLLMVLLVLSLGGLAGRRLMA